MVLLRETVCDSSTEVFKSNVEIYLKGMLWLTKKLQI